MSPDKLKEVWQAQLNGRHVTINADIVLRELERSKARTLWADVCWLGVVGLAFGYVLWVWMKSHYWPVLVMAVLAVVVFVFAVVVDQFRLSQRPKHRYSDPLLVGAEDSLAQVNRQIWLLKNVLWCCLLPISVGLLLLFGYAYWSLHETGLWSQKTEYAMVCRLAYWFSGRAIFVSSGIALYLNAIFCLFAFWGVYRVSQWVVKKKLEPRRQDLETILKGLSQDCE